ncbi:MAG: hypothetical protein J1E99_08705 [Muribaculaceae bacterium]|nr:hypothetical protein [Muribaculaceae bacterium]
MDLGNLNLNGGLVKVIQYILSSGKSLFSLDELKSLAGSDFSSILNKLHDAKALIPTKDGEVPDLGILKNLLSQFGGDKLGGLPDLGGLGKLFK